MDVLKEIGKQLEMRRRLLGINKEDMAKHLKMAPITLDQIENGERNFKIKRYFAICEAYKIDPLVLLARALGRNDPDPYVRDP